MNEKKNKHDETTPDYNWLALALLIIFSLFFWGFKILYLNYIKATATGKFTECMKNLENVAVALEMYADDNDKKYPEGLGKLTPHYIKEIPTCPGHESKFEIIKQKRPGYQDAYKVNKDFSAYTFYCATGDHDLIGITNNYPQYTSTKGLVYKP